MVTALRSPLVWVGGKHYSRKQILAAFPPSESYRTFVDVFGGAAHILLAKPSDRHLEVYNDYCHDLVNFWMQCRNQPEEFHAQIESLPYARSLYEIWQESLFNETPLSDMERAVRWFYVLRSSIGGIMRKSKGNWGYSILPGHDTALYLYSAASLFSLLSQRLKGVQIECSDFERLIKRYERPTTLFYCDPPYINAESYYQGIPPFTMADHARLAHVLNETSAKVALSYYPHEVLDEWYPSSKWQRITWQTYKHAEKTREKRQMATELLLMNYTREEAHLWGKAEGK